MKYEMLLGKQEKFIGHKEDAEILLWHDFLGQKAVTFDEAKDMVDRGETPAGSVVIAMRRIIKEPKRWTWEDKKAGRLPEIGSIFTYRNETLTCHFIDDNDEVWAHDIDNKIVTPLLRDCQPIETPEEKVQREQEEFVASFNSEKYSNPTLYREGLRDAYRKLKGGE